MVEGEKERHNCINFKPYEMSPKSSRRIKSNYNQLSEMPQVPLSPYFGIRMLPSPALLSPFTAGLPQAEPSSLIGQALLHRIMFNNPSQAPMVPFPPLFNRQTDVIKPATATSRKTSPQPQSQPTPLDLSFSTSKIISSSSATLSAFPSPIVVEPRLSPGRSSSGASSPDSGVCSGNASHLNDSTPLDLSSSYS